MERTITSFRFRSDNALPFTILVNEIFEPIWDNREAQQPIILSSSSSQSLIEKTI